MGNAVQADAAPPSTTEKELALLPPALRPLPKWPTVACLAFAYTAICAFLSFGFGAWAILSSLGLLTFLLFLLAEPAKEQHPTAPWLALCGLLMVSSAAAVGVTNYHTHYALYLTADSGWHYGNVTTSDSPASMGDASRITFQNARPDSSRSLGWRAASFTYCVAPIVSMDNASTDTDALTSVRFWAVGVDCCAARGEFDCDDSKVLGTSETSVLREDDAWGAYFLAPIAWRKESYDEAIAAAAALYGLQSPEPRILVRWTADADSLAHVHLYLALGTWLLSSVFWSLGVCYFWVGARQYYDNEVRKAWAARKAQGTRDDVEWKPAWLSSYGIS